MKWLLMFKDAEASVACKKHSELQAIFFTMATQLCMTLTETVFAFLELGLI